MKYRVLTTDHHNAPGTLPTLEYHEAGENYDNARQLAEELKDQHDSVSVYRYAGGEPDLMWSTRAEVRR